jgi:uncharacterized membrane protein
MRQARVLAPPIPDTLTLTTEKGRREEMSCLLIIFLVIVVLVAGLGFVVKSLFWVALALFLIWIITLLWDRIRKR